VKTKDGFVEKQVLKATTVHQELRVLRRRLNVAGRKKFLFTNPWAGVEFPARVDGLFRPHYVTWPEQQVSSTGEPDGVDFESEDARRSRRGHIAVAAYTKQLAISGPGEYCSRATKCQRSSEDAQDGLARPIAAS